MDLPLNRFYRNLSKVSPSVLLIIGLLGLRPSSHCQIDNTQIKHPYPLVIDLQLWGSPDDFDTHKHVINFISSTITKLQDDKVRAELTEEKSRLRFWLEVLILSLILSASVAIIITYRSVMRRQKFKQWKKELKITHDFELRLAQYELTSLRAQMNPHFLFNSLNSINRYILKSDPDTASQYLTKFSRLIRRILDNSMSSSVPLVHELEAVKLYLEIESMRFENKFSFTIMIKEHINPGDVNVPPLIMQPYIENSIWHGLLHKKATGILSITIDMNDHDIIYIIEDNGVGREAAKKMERVYPEKKKSYGMSVSSTRLELLTRSSKSSIVVDDLKNDQGEATGTRVTVKIPTQLPPESRQPSVPDAHF